MFRVLKDLTLRIPVIWILTISISNTGFYITGRSVYGFLSISRTGDAIDISSPKHETLQNLYFSFHEYFHGDDGAGLGASHQTGWTGLVAKLIQQSGGTTETVDEADNLPHGSNPAPVV